MSATQWASAYIVGILEIPAKSTGSALVSGSLVDVDIVHSVPLIAVVRLLQRALVLHVHRHIVRRVDLQVQTRGVAIARNVGHEAVADRHRAVHFNELILGVGQRVVVIRAHSIRIRIGIRRDGRAELKPSHSEIDYMDFGD